MERDSKSIRKIINKIIFLLEASDEQDWVNCFKKILREYDNPANQAKAAKQILNIYKGGMGSFMDLVLQKNFKMLVDENNQLANLKHELYNACLDYCSINQININ